MVQYGAVWCSEVQCVNGEKECLTTGERGSFIGRLWSNCAQIDESQSVVRCSKVQYGVVWCSMVQQESAVLCSKVVTVNETGRGVMQQVA